MHKAVVVRMFTCILFLTFEDWKKKYPSYPTRKDHSDESPP